jgi:hypothetical protein
VGHARLSVLVAAAGVSLGAAGIASASSGQDAGLKVLLVRAGEMPGFHPSGQAHVFRSVAQDVAHDPSALRKADAAHLRKDGFVAEIIQPQQSSPSTRAGGTSGMTELSSPAAARSYARFTFSVVAHPGPVAGTSQQQRFVRFKVPGVPGARGVAEISRQTSGTDANVQWVEGRCLVQVGDATVTRKPLTVPLVAAAQAVYGRTHGSCASS